MGEDQTLLPKIFLSLAKTLVIISTRFFTMPKLWLRSFITDWVKCGIGLRRTIPKQFDSLFSDSTSVEIGLRNILIILKEVQNLFRREFTTHLSTSSWRLIFSFTLKIKRFGLKFWISLNTQAMKSNLFLSIRKELSNKFLALK